MDIYYQATLFNVDDYASEQDNSDALKVIQIREFRTPVEYEQLELDLFPEPLEEFSFENRKVA